MRRVIFLIVVLFLAGCSQDPVLLTGEYSEQGQCSENIGCKVVSDCACGWICASDILQFEACPQVDCENTLPRPNCECTDGFCKVSK